MEHPATTGGLEAAVVRLERAFEERDPQLPFIELLGFKSFWKPVLEETTVEALMRKVGLPA